MTRLGRRALLAAGVIGAVGLGLALAPERGAADGQERCPVIESRDWAAWIDAQPGPGAERRLIVTGEVDLPTPGYGVEWRVGPADRRLPPAQYLDLVLTPPSGVVIQVVAPTPVRFETPAVYPQYRASSSDAAKRPWRGSRP